MTRVTKDLSIPKNLRISEALTPNNFMTLISESKGICVTPSYSTVQDAAYAKTPIFFLPEQNGLLPLGYDILKRNGIFISHNATLTDIIYEGKIKHGEEDVENLYNDLKNLFSNERTYNNIISRISNFVTDVSSIYKFSLITKQNYHAMKKMIGGYDAKKQIAKRKEFNDTKYDGELHDIKEQSRLLCNADFEIMPHQLFVKNFLSFQSFFRQFNLGYIGFELIIVVR
jgi:hypothetical protein